MQPKVSMVIPCYNKEKYIGNMFDSILSQEWDNIELILVNDGSTDGTRRIISEYESRFLDRGFEVLIIDQENRGVAGAVYTGFLRISGDYVCQVDADDELDREYVRKMAGWLAEHEDYDLVVSDMTVVNGRDQRVMSYFSTPVGCDKMAEQFLLSRCTFSISSLMVRTSYLQKCGVLEHFYVDRECSQESQVALPLAAGGGKRKHIRKSLYRALYVNSEDHHSSQSNYADKERYFEHWYSPVRYAINHLPFDENTKQRYRNMAELEKLHHLINYAHYFECEETASEHSRSYVTLVNRVFSLKEPIVYENAYVTEMLIRAVGDCLLGITPEILPAVNGGKVVAWGALGDNGRKCLPLLAGTPLSPVECWDRAGDGERTVLPHPSDLTAKDIVLILPSVKGFEEEILKEIKPYGCRYIFYSELITYLASRSFSQFYDGTAVFLPEERDNSRTKPAEQPLVSWLMSVYNGERFLRRSIDSMLRQTYRNFEIVIIDDASADGTSAILHEYARRDKRIRVYRNGENWGVARSLNRGISLCRGKYIARMDADDYSYPERLERQVAFMEENPGVGLAGSWIRMIRSGDGGVVIKRRMTDAQIRCALLFGMPFCHPTVILRAALFKEKRWEYPVRVTEDYGMLADIASGTQFAMIDEVLLDYSLHETQLTSSRFDAIRKDMARISKRYIEESLSLDLGGYSDDLFGWRGYDRMPYDIKEFLCQGIELLQKIDEANRVLKRFDTQALRAVLQGQWNITKSLARVAAAFPYGYRKYCKKDIESAFSGGYLRQDVFQKEQGEAIFCALTGEGRVALYGAGEDSDRFLRAFEAGSSAELGGGVVIIDSSPEKWGRFFHGKIIQPPDILLKQTFDMAVIGTSQYLDEVYDSLSGVYHIDEKVIVPLLPEESAVNYEINFHAWRRAVGVDGKTERPRAFIFCAPDYQNLGDHAIAEAEHVFLKDVLGLETFEVGMGEYKAKIEFLKRHIRRDDRLFVTGGGFLGSLWFEGESEARDVVADFPNNPIVILPQTLLWEEGDFWRAEQEKTRRIYESHPNLLFCARNRTTLRLVKELYPTCRAELIPDMALSFGWEGYFTVPAERRGALCCLREDKEALLTKDEREEVFRVASCLCGGIRIGDTFTKEKHPQLDRTRLLKEKLQEFADAKLVITDRLHGFIFAAVTGTPCVAVNSLSHKLRDSAEWLAYLPYLKFAQDVSEVEEMAKTALAAGPGIFGNGPMLPYFDRMADGIKGVSKGESI